MLLHEHLGLTNDDIGEPSGHWRSQVEILPSGDGILNIDDNLDIHEHPECMAWVEGEWRRWAIQGLRDDSEDEYRYAFRHIHGENPLTMYRFC